MAGRIGIKFKRLCFLAAAVGLIVLAGQMNDPIRVRRKALGYEPDPVHGTSPTLMLATTALGAFRGIILDVIWIRMQDLKQDKKFFEIVQLSDLACKMAPRFPKAWAFNAWNMAYNVSVELPELYERWNWVRAGINLLKNEGIPYNPDSPDLYRELAWIYTHKVGGQLDDANLYYKQELGAYMHEVLGGSGTRQQLKALENAPRTADELLAAPNVREFVEKLRAIGFDPLDQTQIFGFLKNPAGIKREIRDVLDARANQPALDAVVLFVRARRLRDECRLDIPRMLQLDDEYGEFDWRSPYPHAIYWATLGLEKARKINKMKAEQQGLKEFKNDDQRPYREIDFDRIFYGAFQDLVRQGRLIFDSRGRLLPWFGPDYRFADAMEKIYEQMLVKYAKEGEIGLTSAHENFLKRMVVEMYFTGSPRQSAKFWKILVDTYPTHSVDYKLPFEQYVRKAFQDYVTDMSTVQATQIVYGVLIRGFLSYGCNDDEAAAQYENFAKAIVNQNNKDSDGVERTEIKYDRIRELVLTDIFSGELGVPESVLDNLRARLGPVADQIIANIEKAKKEGTGIEVIDPSQKMKK